MSVLKVACVWKDCFIDLSCHFCSNYSNLSRIAYFTYSWSWFSKPAFKQFYTQDFVDQCWFSRTCFPWNVYVFDISIIFDIVLNTVYSCNQKLLLDFKYVFKLRCFFFGFFESHFEEKLNHYEENDFRRSCIIIQNILNIVIPFWKQIKIYKEIYIFYIHLYD